MSIEEQAMLLTWVIDGALADDQLIARGLRVLVELCAWGFLHITAQETPRFHHTMRSGVRGAAPGFARSTPEQPPDSWIGLVGNRIKLFGTWIKLDGAWIKLAGTWIEFSGKSCSVPCTALCFPQIWGFDFEKKKKYAPTAVVLIGFFTSLAQSSEIFFHYCGREEILKHCLHSASTNCIDIFEQTSLKQFFSFLMLEMYNF